MGCLGKGGLLTEQLCSLCRLLVVGMLGSQGFKAVLAVVTSLCPGVVVGGYWETEVDFLTFFDCSNWTSACFLECQKMVDVFHRLHSCILRLN